MSKHTVLADGGALPAEGGKAGASPTKIADALDVIKVLVDAACMASSELTDNYQRDAMRGLLSLTSDKISEVVKDFVKTYCGGYINV
jgi:hypothetical protein